MTDAPEPNPFRRLAGVAGTLAAAAFLLVVALVVVDLGSRTAPAASPSPDASIGDSASSVPVTPTLTPTRVAAAVPTPTESPAPTPTTEATPTPTPTLDPTPTPTREPTARPTDEPTPKPTRRPTPKPDDTPNPADPASITKRGDFGDTLRIGDVSVKAEPRDPADESSCETDDPDIPERRLVVFDLWIEFPRSPWRDWYMKVGSKPPGFYSQDGPSPFESGARYKAWTCQNVSDDSTRLLIELPNPEKGQETPTYRFVFD